MRRCTLVDDAFDGSIKIEDKASHSLIELAGEGIDVAANYVALVPEEAPASRKITLTISEILFKASPPDISLLTRFCKGCAAASSQISDIMAEYTFQAERVSAQQAQIERNQRQAEAIEAFKRIDEDNSGELDRGEIERLFEHGLGLGAILLPDEMDILLRDFIALVDQNNDGTVSLEEFEEAFEFFATSSSTSLHSGYVAKLVSEYVLQEDELSNEDALKILEDAGIEINANNDENDVAKMRKVVRALGSYSHAAKIWRRHAPFTLQPTDSAGGLCDVAMTKLIPQDAVPNEVK